MKTTFALCSIVILTLGFFTGCQTVETRIKEKPDAFAQVDKATQDKIRQGIIDLGYSEDLVYLALGAPDRKRESVSATGKTTTWIYNTYYDRYEGTYLVGHYHRQIYFDPYLQTYRLHYYPVFADAYVAEKEQRIRVVFKDGKVSMIEQAKE